MMRKGLFSVLAVAGMVATTGCSGTSAALTGGKMGWNMMKEDSFLRVNLDGQAAEQNKLKKAATGHSEWKIKEPVSTAPTLSFEITKPDKIGRITWVSVSIYQAFEADYSHQAEFTILSQDTNNPQAQMRPNTPYNLGSPGAGLKVLNLTNQTVNGVSLTPGMKYKMLLTVKADKSETAVIHFKTK